jgi:hypothetical protein
MENLAWYIIRASFSQERMQYLAEPSKVVYRAKDGTNEKVFDALEWFAAMCSHIRDRGESCRWREYGIMVTTVMFPGENGKKSKRTESPASWKQIKVRRNTGKTGPG